MSIKFRIFRKTCIVSNKHKDLKEVICKFCKVTNLSYTRSDKTEFTFGEILKNGVVCNSCVKYYKESKICSCWNKKKINISNPTLDGSHKKLLCTSCYNKFIPVCSYCGYRRKNYTYNEKNKTICKICYEVGHKKCISCKSLIPAGYGNICRECSNLKTLNKKVNALSGAFSKYFRKSFINFSKWLLQRRGSLFTSLKIQHYYKYFFLLDELAISLKRIPNYEEIVSKFTILETKKYLLVTRFLDEQNIVNINLKIKEKFANLNMIDRYLDRFPRGSKNRNLIEDYYKYLLEKLEQNKTTIRSIRLSLTPAIKFLEYCDNFKDKAPSNYILGGYLSLYCGQKAAITGFINFLKNIKKINISLINIKPFRFKKTATSKIILEQRLLDLIRLPKIPENKEQLYYRTLIGYLHNIEVPINIFINRNKLKKDKNNDTYILINKQNIYIGNIN